MDFKLENGEDVVCIDITVPVYAKNNLNLTVGKEYNIKNIIGEYIYIENDVGESHTYRIQRFVPKNIYRNDIINEIMR